MLITYMRQEMHNSMKIFSSEYIHINFLYTKLCKEFNILTPISK